MSTKRKKLYFIANWKMSQTARGVSTFVKNAHKRRAYLVRLGKIVICPSFTHIPLINKKYITPRFALGAQDVFWKKSGAYTGEISVSMLQELHVSYAIIGHSERRHLLKEGDGLVHKKLQAVFSAGLVPILCIGETAPEKRSNKTRNVLRIQLKKALSGLKDIKGKRLLIAYEPVWAISTEKNGHIMKEKEIQAHLSFIRKTAKGLLGNTLSELSLLYGGSVSGQNAGPILAQSEVNGFLVGGKSLSFQNFYSIMNTAL